ncbi:hypothetical protein Pcinc_033513 [Petrolisthes cinctipes]|uniref:Uncharacterized protein n=1 Tax=Petrolisthes cinctipes TaxID=88211 RepID=A0AAE1ES54_PETCI|nr:hypothetical protein Pcinc_033513 [Petrolisthes cinctipes]
MLKGIVKGGEGKRRVSGQWMEGGQNQSIVTEKGSHLDIRLPSLTSSLSSSCGGEGSLRSPARYSLRLGYTILPTSAPRYECRERMDLAYRECRGTYRENGYVPNGRPEMTPLTELPSTDSLTDASHDIQSWLEDSSRYTNR